MSRRVHACISCPGRTRHRGPCANPAAPTLAELQAGVDVTPLLAWHGTDCPCAQCAGDRIPGRYA